MKYKIILAINLLFSSLNVQASDWDLLPGAAKDIGVGADGSVWVIGTSRESGGYTIHGWDKDRNGWYKVVGGAVRIDVEPNGTPWVVNSSGNIYRWDGRRWEQKPGAAKDIGIGGDGSIWVIGTGAVSGGYSIHKWNGSAWDKVKGGAVRVDVDAQGIPWVVNSAGNIYRRNGGSWQQMPGAANDIGIGGNTVWVIGSDSTGGGYGIHKWVENENSWLTVSGGATQVSAESSGRPWVVNSSGSIFRRK